MSVLTEPNFYLTFSNPREAFDSLLNFVSDTYSWLPRQQGTVDKEGNYRVRPKEYIIKVLTESSRPLTPGQIRDKTGLEPEVIQKIIIDLYNTGEIALAPQWKVYKC